MLKYYFFAIILVATSHLQANQAEKPLKHQNDEFLIEFFCSRSETDCSQVIPDQTLILELKQSIKENIECIELESYQNKKFLPYILEQELITSTTRLWNGLTPLHIACAWCDFDTIKDLVSKGVHLNEQDNDKNTPLAWLSSLAMRQQGEIDAAEIIEIGNYLFEKGAHLIVNGFDATSLMTKVEKRYPIETLVSFLKEHFAELSQLKRSCKDNENDSWYCSLADLLTREIDRYENALHRLARVSHTLTNYEYLCKQSNLERCEQIAFISAMADILEEKSI